MINNNDGKKYIQRNIFTNRIETLDALPRQKATDLGFRLDESTKEREILLHNTLTRNRNFKEILAENKAIETKMGFFKFLKESSEAALNTPDAFKRNKYKLFKEKAQIVEKEFLIEALVNLFFESVPLDLNEKITNEVELRETGYLFFREFVNTTPLELKNTFMASAAITAKEIGKKLGKEYIRDLTSVVTFNEKYEELLSSYREDILLEGNDIIKQIKINTINGINIEAEKQKALTLLETSENDRRVKVLTESGKDPGNSYTFNRAYDDINTPSVFGTLSSILSEETLEENNFDMEKEIDLDKLFFRVTTLYTLVETVNVLKLMNFTEKSVREALRKYR